MTAFCSQVGGAALPGGGVLLTGAPKIGAGNAQGASSFASLGLAVPAFGVVGRLWMRHFRLKAEGDGRADQARLLSGPDADRWPRD